jgi:hypothetical protein
MFKDGKNQDAELEYLMLEEDGDDDDKDPNDDDGDPGDRDEDDDNSIPPGSRDKKVDESIELIDDTIEESMHIDYETVPTGHVGAFTDAEMDYAVAMEKIKEKYAALAAKEAKQRKLMEQAVQAIDNLEEENASYVSTAKQLKKKLFETNLTNAKLYYTNRVLASPSLNERQKQHLVEALSQADSPKQAKTIFETLQNSVGSGNNSQGPKSLSEAVERRSLLTVSPHRRKEVATVEDVVSERWKRLAGIN